MEQMGPKIGFGSPQHYYDNQDDSFLYKKDDEDDAEASEDDLTGLDNEEED